MSTSRRKKPTKEQRSKPCEACGYPLSQCHHLYPVSRYNVPDDTVQLCANCHELYHLLYNGIAKDSKQSRDLFKQAYKSMKVEIETLRFIFKTCIGLILMEVKMGYVKLNTDKETVEYIRWIMDSDSIEEMRAEKAYWSKRMNDALEKTDGGSDGN